MLRVSWRILAVAFAAACALGTTEAAAQSAAWTTAAEQCLNKDGRHSAAEVVAGCTFVIDDPGSGNSNRSKALILRAKQRVRAHDFKSAWPDFDRAISIAVGDDLARAYAARADARVLVGRKAEADADMAEARKAMANWLDIQADFARSKLTDCLTTNAGDIIESDEHYQGTVAETQKALQQARSKCANEEAAYRQSVAAKQGLRSISDSQFEESRKSAEDGAFNVLMDQLIGDD